MDMLIIHLRDLSEVSPSRLNVPAGLHSITIDEYLSRKHCLETPAGRS